MWMQNRINQTLNSPDALPLLERILSQAQRETRSEVGRRVCAAFDLVDGRGRLQLAGCLKALRALADAETIVLPAPRRAAPANTPVRHEGPVPAPVDVPGGVAAIGDLAVVAVESRADRKVWNTLIADEHPRGLATFAGCQRRYLVHSAHGWLGAVGFSASALRLAARERWMAWSDGQRKLFLDRVVCMSRFLIPGFPAPIWPVMFWGGFCVACRAISTLATATARGLWRPLSIRPMTGPVCGRRTSFMSGGPPAVAVRTATTGMPKR